MGLPRRSVAVTSSAAVNLAAGLARIGRRVLLADLDPQGHATYGLGIDFDELPPETPTVERLFADDRLPLARVVMKTAEANLDLLPADIRLARAAAGMHVRNFREPVHPGESAAVPAAGAGWCTGTPGRRKQPSPADAASRPRTPRAWPLHAGVPPNTWPGGRTGARHAHAPMLLDCAAGHLDQGLGGSRPHGEARPAAHRFAKFSGLASTLPGESQERLVPADGAALQFVPDGIVDGLPRQRLGGADPREDAQTEDEDRGHFIMGERAPL